jgi:hypothetical protein
MVYALHKFRHYLIGKHFNMFTDHSSLRYLFNKPMLVGRIFKWLLCFQEFDFDVVVKTERLNEGSYHLSRIHNGEEPIKLENKFSDAQLFQYIYLMSIFLTLLSF